MVQLAVCGILFLGLLVGRYLLPTIFQSTRAKVLEALGQDTDFVAVFSGLGQAVDEGGDPGEVLNQAWVAVLGGAPEVEIPVPEPTLELVEVSLAPMPTADVALPSPQPSVEPQLVEPTAMLDLNETVAPVMATISSDYGWRTHPITGVEQFHTGVDLAADKGADIGAFAAGEVDFIGESPVYGQYIQVNHGDGITSFYAHCSELCAQPGQQVEAGETIAKVGDTGETTGAHLHFELKQNDVQLDPVDYIQTLS